MVVKSATALKGCCYPLHQLKRATQYPRPLKEYVPNLNQNKEDAYEELEEDEEEEGA